MDQPVEPRRVTRPDPDSAMARVTTPPMRIVTRGASFRPDEYASAEDLLKANREEEARRQNRRGLLGWLGRRF